MKKIIIVIERSADLFDAYSDNCDGIYGAGNSIEECKKDIELSIAQIKEKLPWSVAGGNKGRVRT